MTSKRSFAELMNENRKRRLWSLALSIIGNIFALPVFAALMMGVWEERLADGLTKISEIQHSFYNMVLGCGNIPVLLIVCALALINGLNGMAYMHNRAKTDLYGSLPVKRTELFSASYINGLLFFAIPYIVMETAALIIGVMHGFFDASLLPLLLLSVLSVIIFYAAIYTIVCLGAVLSGNTIVSIFLAGILLFYLPLALAVYYGYGSIFFVNFGNNSGELLKYLSPVLTYIWVAGKSFISEVREQDVLSVLPTAGGVALSLVTAVLLFFLVRFLAGKRGGEAAGRAIAFKGLRPVLKVCLMVEGTLLFMLFFYSVTSVNSGAPGWMLFGYITGIILIHSVIEIVYEFDFRAFLRHRLSFIIGAVLTAAVSAAFMFDFFGYDRYIPDSRNIASAAVYGYSLSGRTEYYNENGDYRPASEWVLQNMSLTDIDDVRLLAQKGVEFSDKRHKDQAGYLLGMPYPGNTGYFADEGGVAYGVLKGSDEGKAYTNFQVCFRLNNGLKIYRSYNVDLSDKDAFDAFSGIFSQNEFKKTVYQAYSAETGDLKKIKVLTNSATRDIAFTEEEKDKFLRVFRQDMDDMTAADLKGAIPCMEVVGLSNSNDKTDPISGYYDFGAKSTGFFIYPSFKRCISFLESKNIFSGYDADGVISVEVEMYDDEGSSYRHIYENPGDKEKIEEILSRAVRDEFYYACTAFLPERSNEAERYSVNVSFKKSPAYEDIPEETIYYEFLSDDIPEFFDTDLKTGE